MIYKYCIFSRIETLSSPQCFAAFCLIPQFCRWGIVGTFLQTLNLPLRGCWLLGHHSLRQKPPRYLTQPLAGILWGTAYRVLIKQMLYTNPVDFHPVFLILLPKDWKSRFRACHSLFLHALKSMHMLSTRTAYVLACPYKGSLGFSGSL